MLQVVVSVTERDGLDVAVPTAMSAFVGAVCEVGMEIEQYHEVTAWEADALGSSWAKRLGIPFRRTAWLLRARKL